MAKRRFKLPDYNDLTKDQDRAMELKREGQFLVIGGPGTGKSVVALWRTIRQQKNNDHLFLTYNHVLKAFTCQYVESNIQNDTAYSWFYKTFYLLTKKFVPKIDDFKPDYDQIIQVYNKLNLDESNTLYFVVDEGQDLPQGFYESIMTLGYENFFIVADQNQQITDERSSLLDLANILDRSLKRDEHNDILDKNIVELKENFRNTKEIAVLSQHFYTDKATPKPDLPKTSSEEIPTLYRYELVDNCVKMMLREADRDPSQLIGLIVATDTKREDYVRRLKKVDIDRDYEKPLISSYDSNKEGNIEIDFSQGGIVVITDKSSKGIEFDVVFIVLDGLMLYQGDTRGMKKRLYVMTSRARKKLVLFRGMSCDQAVSDLMPDDETILKRKTI